MRRAPPNPANGSSTRGDSGGGGGRPLFLTALVAAAFACASGDIFSKPLKKLPFTSPVELVSDDPSLLRVLSFFSALMALVMEGAGGGDAGGADAGGGRAAGGDGAGGGGGG